MHCLPIFIGTLIALEFSILDCFLSYYFCVVLNRDLGQGKVYFSDLPSHEYLNLRRFLLFVDSWYFAAIEYFFTDSIRAPILLKLQCLIPCCEEYYQLLQNSSKRVHQYRTRLTLISGKALAQNSHTLHFVTYFSCYHQSNSE